ncbi:MAG: type II toxin-antitoxin system Phd/YefM family antitoxin [Chitinispirillaceae bacterium]|nr:type II toxin-antitoxin system Phd/YefM family antitoxin [Chitinispirillaceae bacterium]
MTVYTYSEARQKFASLLDKARAEGVVLIRRKDGQVFSMRPEKHGKSPLSVKGIQPFISTKELIEVIREQRSGIRSKA